MTAQTAPGYPSRGSAGRQPRGCSCRDRPRPRGHRTATRSRGARLSPGSPPGDPGRCSFSGRHRSLRPCCARYSSRSMITIMDPAPAAASDRAPVVCSRTRYAPLGSRAASHAKARSAHGGDLRRSGGGNWRPQNDSRPMLVQQRRVGGRSSGWRGHHSQPATSFGLSLC